MRYSINYFIGSLILIFILSGCDRLREKDVLLFLNNKGYEDVSNARWVYSEAGVVVYKVQIKEAQKYIYLFPSRKKGEKWTVGQIKDKFE